MDEALQTLMIPIQLLALLVGGCVIRRILVRAEYVCKDTLPRELVQSVRLSMVESRCLHGNCRTMAEILLVRNGTTSKCLVVSLECMASCRTPPDRSLCFPHFALFFVILSISGVTSAAVYTGREHLWLAQANAAGLGISGYSTSELGIGPSLRSNHSTRL